jgi:hypothetical protein
MTSFHSMVRGSWVVVLVAASVVGCTIKRDLLTDSDADSGGGDEGSGTTAQVPTTGGGEGDGSTTEGPGGAEDPPGDGLPPGAVPGDMCVPFCVSDEAPETPVVDPNCVVLEATPEGGAAEVVRCLATAEGWAVPAGAEVCHEFLIDPDGSMTPSEDDLLPAECVAQQLNLQIVVIRTQPAAPGATVGAVCEPSSDPERDCKPAPVPVPVDGEGCMPVCVADFDPSDALVEPDCAVFEAVPPAAPQPIVPCMEVMGEWVPMDGAAVCFAQLVDPLGTLTPGAADDMSAACVEAGANLQFLIVRDEPAAPGTELSAVCELSDQPEVDCPDL